MKTWKRRGFAWSLSLFVIFHFYTYVHETPWGLALLSVSGASAIVFSLLLVRGRKAVLPLFLIIAALLIAWESKNFEQGLEGLRYMRALISLLFVVPIVSWVLRTEPYIEAVVSVSRNMLIGGNRFYFGMMAITQIIAHFLLFGAIPLVHQFVQTILGNKRGEGWEYFKGTAILRAFGLSTIWVISIPSFIYVVDAIDASLWTAIAQGFVISSGGILIAMGFAYRHAKKHQLHITDEVRAEIDRLLSVYPEKRSILRLFIEFVILFLSLFGTIFVLYGLFKWDLLTLITAVIPVWTVLYFTYKKKLPSFLSEGRAYMTEKAADKSQEFLLLLSAGLMISSLAHAGYAQSMVGALIRLTDQVPFINLVWVLPLMVVILGFTGLGPLSTMVLIGGILGSVQIPFPPELTVLALTSGSVMSIVLSPFVLPVIVLSGSNGLSVWKNGLLFNGGYCVAFYLFVQAYVQLVLLVR